MQKGSLVRPTESHWFEGKCISSSSIWYDVLIVEKGGMAWVAPAGESEGPDTIRLFYLCENGCYEFK